MKRIMNIRLIFIVGALAVVAACQQTTDPAPESSDSDRHADLPDAVSILSGKYYEAYRLLPSDDHSRERIEGEFTDFDLAAWQALEWNPEGYEAAPRTLNLGNALPMLQSAAGRIEDRQWVADRIRNIDPDAADRFLAGKNVFELTAILKELVEEQGYHREVEEISLRFGGMKAGHTQEFIDKTVAHHFAFTDYLEARGKLGDKERAVRENEVSVCVLLMELVVGADPFTTIVDGRCDIDRALRMAIPSTTKQPKSHDRVITGAGRAT